jgi:hypothetical protein
MVSTSVRRGSAPLLALAVGLVISINYSFFLFQVPSRYRSLYTVGFIFALVVLELVTSSRLNPFRY